ncbi:TetR/AcrR family transcriptional regulator [Blastococcus tunisiensis]|uniref:DNA-binding transcriptional regulator, AcrR family n=1 Tax=Blastococcus tunisiensis TaxID=1798228 RepID=A0A1I2HT98_9ACTN|nr:TetR/AcrR family transcriptional regulator [Blastococcus sp. DSM 46838]SFF32540.1 DNA-binding transcriptional regulator, AcrR family [Blastococcus sp. DSM 46838]
MTTVKHVDQVAGDRAAPRHPEGGPPSAAPPQDGRRARWTEHRRARREDLVGAAVAAVRSIGPEFAVDDVARSAGVSKTVIYRYFSDKDELVDAVLDRISRTVLLPRLLGEITREHADDRAALRAVITAFVSLIEDEPELYRFAYAQTGRSGRADLVADAEHQIAGALATIMAARLERAGQPGEPATTWAYGIVGMVQLSAHWWSTARTVPAGELIEQLVCLADGGLGTLLPPAR